MYINMETSEVTHKVVVENTSLPDVINDAMLKALGFAVINIAPKPYDKVGRVISAGVVTESLGIYTQTWDTDDSGVDPEGALRVSRDSMLSSSDFTQATDTTQTVTNKAAWATYRQELRDLPANTPDPENVVWPLSPDSNTTGV